MPQLTIDQAFQIALDHHRGGRLNEAQNIYRQILGIAPRHADALHLLGLLLHQSGQSAAGLGLIEQALAINPRGAHYHSNHGEVLRQTGRQEEAIAAYRRAIALDPNLADAYSNLGNALRLTGKLDEAIASCRRAIAISPRHGEAHLNLGTALHEAGLLEEAAASHRRAIEIRPDYARAHSNLATVLYDLGRAQEAVDAARQAVRVGPQEAFGHWNLGLLLLAMGDLQRGWAECEWRWRVAGFPSQRRDFPQPQWRGEDLAAKTILVHAEQGFGDVIQFCRYVPLLADRGARVVLLCQPELKRLLQALAGVGELCAIGEPLPPFDLHCPIMSLPLAFGTTLETIPAPGPYLRPVPALVQQWRDRLGGEPGPIGKLRAGLKVGLAWAGRPSHENDRNRSIPLAALAPLAEVPDVRFFSLQKGDAARQAQSPPPGMRLADHTSELRDFADTAALIENLDLVVSADTAVVHLAGAMGKPAWVILPFAPDWRWLLGRNDSPWYPSVRLFRQSRPFDWKGAIERARDELSRQKPGGS